MVKKATLQEAAVHVTGNPKASMQDMADAIVNGWTPGGGTGGGAVQSVNGKTGAVMLTGDDISSTLTGSGESITATITEHLQTLKNDENELGTQVSGIEEKIPSKASAKNQLATMEDVQGGGSGLPVGGKPGQIIEKTADGFSWTDGSGLEGDYCSKYGIVDETKSGLPTIVSGNTIKIPAQLVLDIPGVSGLTINASDITYEIKSTTDCTLFFANGEILEATDVFFQKSEPEDGTTGYAAWWNGSEMKFKSNDTGNVFRAANAVRVVKCVFTDGTLTRLCFTGCRVLNKQEYVPTTVPSGKPIVFSGKDYEYEIGNGGVLAKNGVFIHKKGMSEGWLFETEKLTSSIKSFGINSEIGDSSYRVTRIYVKKLNNGADIEIPTTGGTMVVSTPPTEEGTYTMKATVSADGTVTTTWVKDA